MTRLHDIATALEALAQHMLPATAAEQRRLVAELRGIAGGGPRYVTLTDEQIAALSRASDGASLTMNLGVSSDLTPLAEDELTVLEITRAEDHTTTVVVHDAPAESTHQDPPPVPGREAGLEEWQRYSQALNDRYVALGGPSSERVCLEIEQRLGVHVTYFFHAHLRDAHSFTITLPEPPHKSSTYHPRDLSRSSVDEMIGSMATWLNDPGPHEIRNATQLAIQATVRAQFPDAEVMLTVDERGVHTATATVPQLHGTAGYRRSVSSNQLMGPLGFREEVAAEMGEVLVARIQAGIELTVQYMRTQES